MRVTSDEFEFSVATAPATARHRQLAATVIAAMLIAYALVIPFASLHLPRVDSFIPTLFAVIFVSDLIAAVLLFAQFRATGLSFLLVIACSYLFSSLIVVAHVLTYPGAFSTAGLLGAGSQTPAWIHHIWRFGLSVGFAAYAILKLRDETLNSARWAAQSVKWGVAIVVALVGSVVFVTTVWHDLLPPIHSNGRMMLTGRIVSAVVLATSLTALILLMRTRGRSILDLWLAVAAAALAAEGTFILFVVTQRYDLSFYALRLIALPVSKVVLIALIWETMRLYANLAVSNAELRRERANRLHNAGTALAAIAHEIRQPLVGIALNASAGQKMLDQAPPDVPAVKTLLEEIQTESSRAGETFATILRLFRGADQDAKAVDVNELTLDATRLLRKELEDHDVTVATDLAPDAPRVSGHAGQLRSVILNLIQNSIDALAPMTNRPRTINIVTSLAGPGEICISVQDTGPGIESEKLANIFDPFITTKAQGTGLGLAICKMIVEKHGGTLSAACGEDGGARFEMTLPTGSA